MSGRKRRIRASKKRSVLCVLCFITLALLTSFKAKAEAGFEPTGGTESSVVAEKVYRLSPPGKDPRTLHLLAGEKYFHSRELKKAREAFEKALELDSQSAQAHYFLGLIEYEEGNVEEARTRFQIAHECLATSSSGTAHLPMDTKQAQIEFPDEYEPRMYHKDGWYVSPKGTAVAHGGIHSLTAGSTYRIELKPKRGSSWVRTGVVAVIVAFSFFLAR